MTGPEGLTEAELDAWWAALSDAERADWERLIRADLEDARQECGHDARDR